MKKLLSFFMAVLIGLMFVNVHDVVAKEKGKGKKAVMMPAADIKWEDPKMPGAPPGVQFASLWGDMNKGAYGTLVKFTQESNHPLHTHSADVKCVVVSGNFWVALEGGEKKMFGPGSYFMIPGGQKHTSGAEAGTVIFQEGPGAFDMKPVEMNKENMKKD